jgi:bacteriocin-like protein
VSNKTPSQTESAKTQPDKAKTPESQEITDDELEAVSGGMMPLPTPIGPIMPGPTNPGPIGPGPTNPFPDPDVCFTA